MKNNKSALFAMAIVVIMLLSSLVILEDGQVSDATIDDDSWPAQTDYAYKVSYSLRSYDLTVTDLLTSDAVTSWTWDRTTGVGPFNMFYAAISTGLIEDEDALSNVPGHIAYILDPYDLTQAVKWYGTGTHDISNVMSEYNIMLVIPTVYWGVNDSAFYLTNVPNNPANSGVSFKAYAHQVDNANIYPYLAIGVYEAKTVEGKGLMSQTGVEPTNSKTIDEFRADVATANTLITDGAGTYQQWNFYEWTLYKLLAETYIFSFDSQGKAGNTTTLGAVTGLGDKEGPRTTNTSTTYTKDLIENAWGSLWDFIDNTYMVHMTIIAGSGLEPVISLSDIRIVGEDYIDGRLVIGTSGTRSPNYIKTISEDAASFGAPQSINARGDHTRGVPVPDGMYYINSGTPYCVLAGAGPGTSDYIGLSCLTICNTFNYKHVTAGARLAYLMSADAGSCDFYKDVTYHYNGAGTDTTERVLVNNSTPYTLADPTSPHYTFQGWYTKPGPGITTRITEITVSDPATIDIYASGMFDIVTDVSGNGEVTTSSSRSAMGATITISVNPVDHYQLVPGSLRVYDIGDMTKSVAVDMDTMTFTMPGYAVTVAAEFAEIEYNVNIPATEHGSITATPAKGTYGTSVTLTVAPENKHRLNILEVGGQSVLYQAMDGEYTFTLKADTQVDAGFEEYSAAYIDDVTGVDHYTTVEMAMNSGLDYDVFYIGMDLEEDISVTGTDKTFVLRSGKTLDSKVTMTDGPTRTVVDLKGVKADGDMYVYFGSIHINGALVEGDVIVVEGNAVIDSDTVFDQGMALKIRFGSTLSVSPGATVSI